MLMWALGTNLPNNHSLAFVLALLLRSSKLHSTSSAPENPNSNRRFETLSHCVGHSWIGLPQGMPFEFQGGTGPPVGTRLHPAIV